MAFDPFEPSSDYAYMQPFWKMADDIMGGARTMRAAGVTYLPKFEKETEAPYERRLAVSPWTPIYADSLRNLVSKPFEKEVRALEIEGTAYEGLVEDIDGEGNHFSMFACDVFKAGINAGVDWIFVDYPSMPEGATLADERSQGARPVWQRIPARRMLAVYYDKVNGAKQPVLAKIDESTIELNADGEEEAIQRVRVLRVPWVSGEDGNPGRYGEPTWTLYQRGEKAGSWDVVGEGGFTIGLLPIVPFCPSEKIDNTWRLIPPLRDLAYMQVTEYQMASNLRYVQDMTSFPMLKAEGVRKDDLEGVQIGPRMMLVSEPSDSGQSGTFGWLEPAGTAVTVLRDDLERHRSEMREAGMQPLVQKSGGITATATAVAEAKAHSAVQTWAMMLKDALEQAFVITAMWLSLPEEEAPDVFVHTDFSVETDSVDGMRVVIDLEAAGLISAKAAIEEAKRRSILSPDYDYDEDTDELGRQMEDEPDPPTPGIVVASQPQPEGPAIDPASEMDEDT